MNCIIDEYPFAVGRDDLQITLGLRHYRGEKPGPDTDAAEPRRGQQPAVLLLHGGNTSSETFLLPEGGLARYLHRAGLDVWLLDWRASPLVLEPLLKKKPLGHSERAERAAYTLDHVVHEDIREALTRLRRLIGTVPLSMIGHCLGAGATCLALARGVLEEFEIENVVLSTLGLFYEVPWNSWIKAEDFLIERILRTAGCRDIDPHRPALWPKPFADAYERWPRAWLPTGDAPEAELLRRLTFMFGQPYACEALHPSLHGELLLRQFGPMQLGLYQHVSQNVRRGYVAAFDAPDVIDRPRVREARAPRRPGPRANGDRGAPELSPSHDFRPQPFIRTRLTLIIAAENQLWHRDSLDLMYDWLRSIDVEGRRVRCAKRVFAGYRLQELLWGRNAERQVYGAYLEGVQDTP